MQVFKRSLISICLGFALALSGCLEVDNQRIATPAQMAKINPPPPNIDFQSANKRHQILIAIMDSGVDYNHPALAGNIHFTLDSKGRAIGAGWDFLAHDSWPAPYLARTLDFDPEASPGQKEYAIRMRALFRKLVSAEPRLKKFLSDARLLENESFFAYHGTHVAGLAAQRDPRIGLLPYRVLPVERDNSYEGATQDRSQMVQQKINAQIRSAVAKAILDGARVINLSLMVPEIQFQNGGRVSFDGWFQAFRQLVQENPQIVFVGAAGNDSKKEYPKMISVGGQFPCGIPEANVICTTAIDRNGNAAEFSSLPAKDLVQMKALGVNVRAPLAGHLCQSAVLMDYSLNNMLNEKTAPANILAPKLLKECAADPGYVTESGTSMSAPIVSHEIAKILIENPSLTGAQAIEAVQKKFPNGITSIREF